MRRIWSILIICILLFSTSSFAGTRIVDSEDMTSYIDNCEEIIGHQELLEGFLCAACIPYGVAPEQCVDLLRQQGFDYEYSIFTTYMDSDLLNGVSSFRLFAPKVRMFREVQIVISPEVTLFARTEAIATPLKQNDEMSQSDLDVWSPENVDLTNRGKIVSAHLQFMDTSTEEYITWTFASHEDYQHSYWN